MRIFVDARVLNTGDKSGVPEYARFMIENLLKEGENDKFVFFANSFRSHHNYPDFLDFRSFRNFRIPNRLLDLSSKFFRLPKIDKLVRAGVYYSPHLNILALADSRKRILTVHDLSFVHHPEFFGWRERAWHWRQDYRRQIREAGRIIAVSDFTRQDLIQTFNLPPEKVVRIYSGVNPVYRPLNLPPPDRPFIFYLGKIEPRKNIIGLIRAFDILKNGKNFKDLELVIAGGKGWLYDRVFEAAAASPYFQDIKFTGPIPEERALEFYNLASVFVYPSFFEGFGFPPLEAQACGLPVVASNRSSLPEILQDSAILVNPEDEEALAAAIGRVIGSADLMSQLITKGLENVKRFSWPKAAKQCLKLFQQKI